MVRRISNLTGFAIVLTLAVVISLPGKLFAATSPVVTTLAPVSEGLSSPLKLAMDAAGNYYVADQRRGVVKYNPYGAPLMTIKTSGVPMGVAVAQDGKLLVSQLTFIAVYDAGNGVQTGRISDVRMKGAGGLAVDDLTGYIYVADSVANEVQVYTAAGGYSRSIGTGSRGTGSILPTGQLSMPTGLAIERTTRQLAVADTLNKRIQFFNLDSGAFIKSIGLAPNGSAGPMLFASPQAVAFEYTSDAAPVVSRMYVLDTYQNNVQVVDPAGAGAALATVGGFGLANGQLSVPTDVLFDQKNSRLMVVNGPGNITIYGIDGGSNPIDPTPPALGIDPLLTTVYVPSITISGTVAAGARVTVVSGSTALAGQVTYPTPTTWKCDVTSLAAGANTFSVTAKNNIGITAPLLTVSVNYVLPAPALSVSSLIPAVTNSSSMVISGTVDAGSSVTVANTVTAVNGAATVNGTAWSYPVALAEGLNSFSVTAQKEFSAKAAVSVGISLDTVPPVLAVSAISDGSFTSTQVQNVTGTVVDASQVSVLVNNAPVALNGKTFAAPVTLNNGKNEITVVAADAAGNITSDVRTVYFDISKPVVTVVSPMDNSFTNSAYLNVSGLVDKTATVVVAGANAAVNANNQWAGGVSLVPGSNTIEIVATDLYGNTSTVKRTVTLDTTNPVVAITSPSQDIATNKPGIVVAGTVSDNSSATLTYSFNGTTASAPVVGGNFSFAVDFAAEGVYPVTVTVVDPAGNTTLASRNLVYDKTPPALTIQSYTGFAPNKIGGTVEAGASVVVKEGDVPIGVVTASGTKWSVNLTGTHYNPKRLTAVATDAAGNSTVKAFIRK